MKRQQWNPTELFDPRFFTHTVAVSGPMTLVYVSGQVSYDREGIVVGPGDIRAQSEQVFRSLTHNLASAGAGWRDVIKMNAYMVDLNPDALNIYREVRARHIDAARLPASTLVGVDRLVHEDLLLEVEVVAAIPRAEAPAAAVRAVKAPARKPAARTVKRKATGTAKHKAKRRR